MIGKIIDAFNVPIELVDHASARVQRTAATMDLSTSWNVRPAAP